MKNPKLFLYLIIILISILALRLFQIQILKGDFYEDLSTRNYLKFIILPPPRGLILDRGGDILASNKIRYSLYLVPPYDLKKKESYKKITEILNLSYSNLEERLKRVSSYTPAILLKTNLTPKEISLLEGKKDILPPFVINMEIDRVYPEKNLFAHILGYIGEIDKKDLDEGYTFGDLIGKSGLEKIYEPYLRGKKGYKGIELFSGGKRYKLLPSKDPEAGNTLILTIDKGLQKVAYEALGDEVGTVIVSDPFTGEIYALVSKPDFDPNKFIEGFTPEEWKSLLSNEKAPFSNRAISNLYPPGSIFKLIVALCALEDNKVSLQENFYCRGGMKLGDIFFSCWKKEGHGRINFLEGIAQSCNVVFFNLGLRVGADRIYEMAEKFGLDEKTGIDLPGELKGFIPSPQWKKEMLRESWYPGDTLNMSIGQGYILVTPLGIHFMVSMIATEGLGYRPHLLKKILGSNGEDIFVYEPVIEKKVSLKKGTWKILREGMRLVTERGTGKLAKGKIWGIGGKTGTAENPHGESHAWFSAFFPFDNPRYVVTVFVEHGKSGGAKAAPIAGKIVEYIEEKEVENLGKDIH